MAFAKFNPIDVIVVASYYLFSLFLALSLTGLFKREYIIAGLAVGVLLGLIFLRRRIEFSKSFLFFLAVIPLLLTGILLTRGAVGGDAVTYYLPWAREIVLQGGMPDFLFNTPLWFTSREPLMPLFLAGMFDFLGFKDWVVFILPFLFVGATAFLIYKWLLEKGVSKNYVILGILLLLTNPLFLDRAGIPIQEAFILFFFTAFFYYLEKLQNNDSRFYLVLIFLSAVLASVSKLSGLFLFFPLGWLLIKNFKNQQFRKTYFYLLLTAFPLLLWLLRNYLIYDSPFFPLLNEIFKGRYYSIVLAANQIAQGFNPPFWANILARITEVSVSLVLLFCPLIILSFYSFWKKRKIEYILLFFISFLTVLLFIANQEYIRYIMPFLAVFIVYAVVGLAEIKSRIFLSMIFFLNLWGLFATKISLSQSQFFAPVEGMLNDFLAVSQFVYDYKLILALAFSVFFFFLISPYRQSAKYLILMVVFTYLVKTQVFHLGTWLNIWLPILGLIFIILAWRSVIKLKEEKLLKLIVAYLAVLLIFNSWGLCTAYFLAHRNFVFPNVAEEYGAQPEAAAEIEKLEQGNRDFYIYAASPSYFTWYHNFKTVASRALTFHVITNLEYQENLNSSEVYDLFKRSRIKYVVDNHYWPQLEPFFDKIKSRSDLFEPIFQKKGVYLWQVK